MALTRKEHNAKPAMLTFAFFPRPLSPAEVWIYLTELFYLKIKYDKDLQIEPNAFPTSELYNDNPFVKEILRTGREIVF